MNPLATIERVDECVKHPNADVLYIVTVRGWQCVTRNQYSPGDLVVYVRVDTTVPRKEPFLFLFDENGDKERERVKTITLRGAVSQGLVFPVSEFPEIGDVLGSGIELGAGVQSIIGVEKFEKPVPHCNGAIGLFPTDLFSKTDEENLQNIPEILDEFEDDETITVTFKLDGTSGTFIKHDGVFHVCGRNIEYDPATSDNAFCVIAKRYELAECMLDGTIIQGELVGPGIQKNPLKLSVQDFFVFNTGLIRGRKQNGYGFSQGIVSCINENLKMVPYFFRGALREFKRDYGWSVKSLTDVANSLYYPSGVPAEGIVVRPDNDRRTLTGNRLSFKIVSPKYDAKS